MSAFMPYTLARCPDEGDPEPDDSQYYPGPIEAEFPPDEYDMARAPFDEYPDRMLAIADYYDAEAMEMEARCDYPLHLLRQG